MSQLLPARPQIVIPAPRAPRRRVGQDLQIALAHDYLTQRGGAERVVEAMARAFPGAPVHTTLYRPDGTFPSLADLDVRVSPLNRIGALRHEHRLALPLLRSTIDRMYVDADVLLASSSGWAHGIRCTGRKVVYCHAPARWLYQTERYLGAAGAAQAGHGARDACARLAIAALGGSLRRWDRRAATSADRYVVNSTVVQQAVRSTYGIEAEVLAPPPTLQEAGATQEVPGLERPFVLCVARLLPYKNVDVVIDAVRAWGGADLVVVGSGPERDRLVARSEQDPRVHLLGRVSDAELRWLYGHSTALVAASYEDYGLTPLEAAVHGKPTVALRAGGYLDTLIDGVTGLFFPEPTSEAIARSLDQLRDMHFEPQKIRAHAASFGEDRFAARLREIVAEVA